MKTAVKIKNIHKSFEIGSVNENHVLKGINLTIHEGEFITIIGGNGAGKSTFLNSIAGTFPIDSGKIIIGDKDVTQLPANKRAQYISRVFQDTKMGTAERLTIEENMAIADMRGKKRKLRSSVTNMQRLRYKEEIKKLDLGLENRLNYDVGLLSGGQRQALTLLMASLITPKLLLLDEHTAALDPKTSQMVMDLTQQIVENKKITTLMITHDMQQAITHGNRLIMMHNGHIVVDITGAEKNKLTVPDLLQLFKENSGEDITDDALLLK